MVEFQRDAYHPTVDDILDDRHNVYGRFVDLAEVACKIRNLILDEIDARQKTLAPDQEEALTMLATKLARIINGDAGHVDSWRDAGAYLQLVADRLEGKIR
jgi:hypothetical protein